MNIDVELLYHQSEGIEAVSPGRVDGIEVEPLELSRFYELDRQLVGLHIPLPSLLEKLMEQPEVIPTGFNLETITVKAKELFACALINVAALSYAELAQRGRRQFIPDAAITAMRAMQAFEDRQARPPAEG